ncbi:UNVERIFIED_CONTAM: hypothetical protein GTU68_014724 [Idotea baltica]|nr:hypothetical protein [Idotea baltica]
MHITCHWVSSVQMRLLKLRNLSVLVLLKHVAMANVFQLLRMIRPKAKHKTGVWKFNVPLTHTEANYNVQINFDRRRRNACFGRV